VVEEPASLDVSIKFDMVGHHCYSLGMQVVERLETLAISLRAL